MTRERQSFASLETLFAFLKAQVDDEAGPQPEMDADRSVLSP